MVWWWSDRCPVHTYYVQSSLVTPRSLLTAREQPATQPALGRLPVGGGLTGKQAPLSPQGSVYTRSFPACGGHACSYKHTGSWQWGWPVQQGCLFITENPAGGGQTGLGQTAQRCYLPPGFTLHVVGRLGPLLTSTQPTCSVELWRFLKRRVTAIPQTPSYSDSSNAKLRRFLKRRVTKIP